MVACRQVRLRASRSLGAWLNVHGEGIYGTRICSPYFSGDWAFTCKENEHRMPSTYTQMKMRRSTSSSSFHIRKRWNESSSSVVDDQEGVTFAKEEAGVAVDLPQASITEEAPITQTFRLFTRPNKSPFEISGENQLSLGIFCTLLISCSSPAS